MAIAEFGSGRPLAALRQRIVTSTLIPDPSNYHPSTEILSHFIHPLDRHCIKSDRHVALTKM